MAKGDRRARILERVEREKVKFMRLQFTDILGATKNVEVPDRQFGDALDGAIMFDGSSIEGFVRIEESDMYLKPDLDTFDVFPWTYAGSERVARIICDIANPDGTPFPGCPRSTLKRTVALAEHPLGLVELLGEAALASDLLDQLADPGVLLGELQELGAVADHPGIAEELGQLVVALLDALQLGEELGIIEHGRAVSREG